MSSYRRCLKSSCIIAFISGIGWIGYQIHATYAILNTALDTSVIEHLETKPKNHISFDRKYIYLPHQPKQSPSLFDRFWDSITFSYARRLLNIAQSEDRDVRFRAVNSLAQIKSLDAWHYSILAHMIDARTAVGLARSQNVNLSFFVKPPNRYIFYNHDKIIKWMKHFLINLNERSKHACISYFINKAFVNAQEVGRMVEHEISSAELRQCIQSADDILPLCVQSILHHSYIGHNARDIVQLNGLPLLMEIHKRFKDNIDIQIALMKILSNISIHPELLQDIFRSGWIGVLAKQIKHNDIRVSGPAARALANLDSDDHLDGQFESKVYLLHPTYRATQHMDVDIILVHGLLGGVFYTWRQRDRRASGVLGVLDSMSSASDGSLSTSSDPSTREFIKEVEETQKQEWNDIGKDFEIVFHDCPLASNEEGPYSCSGEELCCVNDNKYSQCWPKDWLPQDCRNLRILGINYDTSLSMWAPICPAEKTKCTLDDRSADFVEKLLAAGVGQRPIVWLTHSMGGLLVKNMLVKAWESGEPRVRQLCSSTKGIVFYSTPHKGSQCASLKPTTSLLLWPSIEVRELKEGSPELLKLHNKFLTMLENIKIDIISFVETESTLISPLKLNFHFVPDHSARILGEYYQIPLDHLRICKPVNRHSFLYRKVLYFIQNIAQR